MKISLFAVCALLATAEPQEKQVVVVDTFSRPQSPFISRSDMLCQKSRDQIIELYGRVQPSELQSLVDKFLSMNCQDNSSIPLIERHLIVKLTNRLSDDAK